jgi:hypothetical protein
MSDELEGDYFAAAAAVVEAARELETANDEFKAANDAALDAHCQKAAAEKKLKEALEDLKHADTGRKSL